jgi:plastocyanin
LTSLTRRRFGQGAGVCLALAGLHFAAAVAHPGPHEVEVRIADFAFAPARVGIRVGDTVVWLNDDLAPHTATAVDGTWDTGTLEAGARGFVRFRTPGEFTYSCAFHPHMTATVIVRDRSGG